MKSKTTLWITAIALTFSVLYLICRLFLVADSPPPSGCAEPGACPGRPDMILQRGVIIELKNFYTLSDLEGGESSFVVCRIDTEKGDSLVRIDGRRGERYSVRDTNCIRYPTGKEVFVKTLNNVLYGVGETPKISDTDTLTTQSCDCADEIFQLELPPDALNHPNIENRVASGTSQTKEENNGIIGAIGFNYDLSATMNFYDEKLKPARTNVPGFCGVLVNYRGVMQWRDKKYRTEKSMDWTAILEEIREDCPRCKSPAIIDLDTPPGGTPTARPVSVAVIDSGTDPFHKYGNPVSAPASLGSSFHLTNETVALGTNPPALIFDYGSLIPHDAIDVNGNCLTGDYYGHDYYGHDNNPADKNGHGTHVAGIILNANQSANHPIRVVPLQFGDMKDDSFSGDLFAAICAINHAVERKVDIINMSWGYSSKDTSEILYRQIRKAYDAGILMVASAGNEGKNVDECLHWPSHFSTFDTVGRQLISVAALDTFTDNNVPVLADYSNFGQSIDLAAPGTNIKSALLHSVSGTVELSGTSMAAAVVSRRAAIMLGSGNGPRPAADQLKQMLLNAAVTKPEICVYGGLVYLAPEF